MKLKETVKAHQSLRVARKKEALKSFHPNYRFSLHTFYKKLLNKRLLLLNKIYER